MKIIFIFLLCLTGINITLANAEKTVLVPNCQLTEVNKTNTFDLKQYKGKVLYIDFWASWCPPCLKSFPFMDKIQHKFKDKGLKVIAINLDEQRQQAKSFLEKNPVNFLIAYDNGMRNCAQEFNVMAMPSSYIIDRKGIVRHVHLGFKAGETEKLHQLIEQMVNE